MKDKQYLLMILDGVAINSDIEGNAFKSANKPNIDKIFEKYKTTRIKASGFAVGLPEGQMGNSEVGHTNIGAGRVVYQELPKISKSIEDKTFFDKVELNEIIKHCKKNNSSLHLMGLLSDGGVHSHINHLYGLLELAKKNEIKKVYIHCFMDGRDTAPTSGLEYLKELEEKIKELGIGEIATITGRFYAMDRDNRWERVEKAYNLVTLGEGTKFKTVQKAIENSYEAQEFDEFIKPICIVDGDEENKYIKSGDGVIFFNFRPDRARELTRAITDKNFDGFERKTGYIEDVCFATMTQYDEKLENVLVVFKPEKLTNTFGEYISNNSLTQLRIAETEKYAHVTFFFNGGEEKQYNGEDRILVASPKVETYDLQPEMSAYEVTDKVIEAIDSKKYDVIVLNFANGDMVGHTGNFEKAVEAIEHLDKCVGKIVDKIETINGVCIITADHGNCEYMIDKKTGEAITSHSTFDVPLVIVTNDSIDLKEGKLCDITPTLLDLMNLDKPSDMTGVSLLVK